jgi:putative spermidine/putrescine transport system permease protein
MRGGPPARKAAARIWSMRNFKTTALLLTVPASLVAIGLYAAPILQVLALSLTEPKFGFGNYQSLFANAAVGRVVLTTLKVSVMTTVLTVLASYIVAFAIIHMSAGWRRISLFLVLVPFWISVLVRAFSWITILLLYANLSDIDRRIMQAARSLGARPATIFWRVWLPLSLPGIALATLFVFVFSLGFLVTPALLGAGKTLMIAEYISVQISSTSRWDLATALSTMLLLVVGIIVFAAMRSPALRAAFVARPQQ